MFELIIGLFFLIMMLCFAGVLLRAMWGLLRIGWHYGPWGVLGAVMLIGWWCWPSASEPASERDAYAAAAHAVERATGRPCDYACKTVIADRARINIQTD